MGSLLHIIHFLCHAVIWIGTCLLPIVFGVGMLYLLISLPLRKRERARMFLDLIESGLSSGLSIEEVIIQSSRSNDTSLGADHHLLASYLEMGYGLDRALEKVPGLLPKPVSAFLEIGYRRNGLIKLVPRCRQLLPDRTSGFRSLVNYQIVLLTVANPVVLFIGPFLMVKVAPIFNEIASSITNRGGIPSGLSGTVVGDALFIHSNLFHFLSGVGILIMVLVLGMNLLIFIGMLSGTSILRNLQKAFFPVVDAWELLIPWQKQRLIKHFSMMLSTLLDSGLTESEAIREAGAACENRLFRHRTELAAERIAEGDNLVDAIAHVHTDGRLLWRLKNGTQPGVGLFDALQGWFDGMDAKAFAMEQRAGHVVTTALLTATAFFIVFLGFSFYYSLWQLERYMISIN